MPDWAYAILAVSFCLAAVEALSVITGLRLLLYPPLASMAYLHVLRPTGSHTTWVGAVAAPTLAAGLGVMGAGVGDGVITILVVGMLTMLMMHVLKSDTAPVIAIAILPLVFTSVDVSYPIAIFVLTSVLKLLTAGWRRLLHRGGNYPSSRRAVDIPTDAETGACGQVR